MPLLRPLLVSFSALTLATGAIYPLLVTGLARVIFPRQAQGSPLLIHGQVRGSRMIGQATEDPRYFWGRPSLTAPYATNASASAGSTLAASNPALQAVVARRIQALRASEPEQAALIPQDLVTASASGLDPHISLEAARWQAPRIARLRSVPVGDLLALVEKHAQSNPLGEAFVTVLDLNAALDALVRR